MASRCSFGEGVLVKLDGIHTLDPCVYEEVMLIPDQTLNNLGDGIIHRNVTVIISKCIYCGHESAAWIRQENTEEITDA